MYICIHIYILASYRLLIYAEAFTPYEWRSMWFVHVRAVRRYRALCVLRVRNSAGERLKRKIKRVLYFSLFVSVRLYVCAFTYTCNYDHVQLRNALQHTATHCNTLQHTATHCNYRHEQHCNLTSTTSQPTSAIIMICNAATHTCNTLPRICN